MSMCVFFFQAEDGIRDGHVTGVQTCALPILHPSASTFAQRQLQEVLQLVTGLWGKALLQRQRIASEPLALGGLHLANNPQRSVHTLGSQSMVNARHL